MKTFLRDEIRKVGVEHAVIALSGGIDSALACYLAAQAIGAHNVYAVRLPYRTSSADSLDHAQLVIDALGIHSETVEITDMVDPLIARTPDITPLRKGNLMARARMIVLYDRSAAYKALVVGTSNKTELLLGYGTLFGDMASALNPIGDLYKTQVRQLAQAIGVPQPIVDKPPSADLWIGQTDEEELGLTYAEVDQLPVSVDRRTLFAGRSDRGGVRSSVRGTRVEVDPHDAIQAARPADRQTQQAHRGNRLFVSARLGLLARSNCACWHRSPH